jgi:hypothetical protein
VLERSVAPTLARAHANGLGVIVKEVPANGRLIFRGDVLPFLALSQRRGVVPTPWRWPRRSRSSWPNR